MTPITVKEYAADNKTFPSNIVAMMFKAGTPVTVSQELTIDQVAYLNTLKPWPVRNVGAPKGAYSSRTADKFVVRLTDGLRHRIQVMANAKHRSMNSQILHYLEMCVALDELSENGFTQEDLQTFAEMTPADSVIVPMQQPIYTPAPGCPVRVANDGGVWKVRNYVVRDGNVKAILEAFVGESNKDTGLLDVCVDQLEPL